METFFKGIQVSSGYALAKAFVFSKHEIIIDKNSITIDNVGSEKNKYMSSVVESRSQIETLKNQAKSTFGEEELAIFDAHIEILEDTMLEGTVFAKIESEHKNVELALSEAMEEISNIFLSLEDEYLRARGKDVLDVCTRIMYNLKGIENISLSNLTEESIVISKDLTPSDTASMDLNKVKGLITDMGGKTDHTAIIARSLELPAIVGMGNFVEKVVSGDFVILDGISGMVIVNPSEATIKEYTLKKQKYEENKRELSKIKDLETITLDGKLVELCANIGNPKDVDSAKNNGALGIGLFRTEFLYMENKHLPTEDEQFENYKKVAISMGKKPVIIRTLDIGGDKELPYRRFDHEMNPFLGYRAIRICLQEVDIFKTQLRAILRSSHFGKIKIMFPMIIAVSELRQAKLILNECMDELRSQNVPFDENIEVGIMVETPAAVFLADKLIKECDFFSIGTNDLTQYTLAVDRRNEKISALYNSFNPAVLICIKNVIKASHNAGKWTGMCGEFASNEKAVLLLIGLGLDEFSMSASEILVVKNLIRKISYKEMVDVCEKALAMDTAEEIEDYLEGILKKL